MYPRMKLQVPLFLSSSSGINNSTTAASLLTKVVAWYDFENNINDGWGCWPLTSENRAPTYGASPSGQAMLTGNVESYATFPNWGDPAKLFGLGCFVSSSNFTDDTFNIT